MDHAEGGLQPGENIKKMDANILLLFLFIFKSILRFYFKLSSVGERVQGLRDSFVTEHGVLGGEG